MPIAKKTGNGGVAATEHNPKPAKRTQQSTDPNLTSTERANLKDWAARTLASTGVRFKPYKDDPSKVAIDHADPEVGVALLMDAIGTVDQDFLNGLISQLARFNGEGGEVNFSGLNFMLSVIKGLGPRDQFEAMLGAQMAAVQVATMMVARRFMVSENIAEQESTERSFNKLSRTFVTQMECLKRYRASGPQMVQNVSVGEGGQAIVANLGQPPTGGTRVGASALPTGETNVVPLEARERMSVPSPSEKQKIERKS